MLQDLKVLFLDRTINTYLSDIYVLISIFWISSPYIYLAFICHFLPTHIVLGDLSAIYQNGIDIFCHQEEFKIHLQN